MLYLGSATVAHGVWPGRLNPLISIPRATWRIVLSASCSAGVLVAIGKKPFIPSRNALSASPVTSALGFALSTIHCITIASVIARAAARASRASPSTGMGPAPGKVHPAAPPSTPRSHGRNQNKLSASATTWQNPTRPRWPQLTMSRGFEPHWVRPRCVCHIDVHCPSRLVASLDHCLTSPPSKCTTFVIAAVAPRTASSAPAVALSLSSLR